MRYTKSPWGLNSKPRNIIAWAWTILNVGEVTWLIFDVTTVERHKSPVFYLSKACDVWLREYIILQCAVCHMKSHKRSEKWGLPAVPTGHKLCNVHYRNMHTFLCDTVCCKIESGIHKLGLRCINSHGCHKIKKIQKRKTCALLVYLFYKKAVVPILLFISLTNATRRSARWHTW